MHPAASAQRRDASPAASSDQRRLCLLVHSGLGRVSPSAQLADIGKRKDAATRYAIVVRGIQGQRRRSNGLRRLHLSACRRPVHADPAELCRQSHR